MSTLLRRLDESLLIREPMAEDEPSNPDEANPAEEIEVVLTPEERRMHSLRLQRSGRRGHVTEAWVLHAESLVRSRI